MRRMPHAISMKYQGDSDSNIPLHHSSSKYPGKCQHSSSKYPGKCQRSSGVIRPMPAFSSGVSEKCCLSTPSPFAHPPLPHTCAALFATSSSVTHVCPANICTIVCCFHQLTARRPHRLKQAPGSQRQEVCECVGYNLAQNPHEPLSCASMRGRVGGAANQKC